MKKIALFGLSILTVSLMSWTLLPGKVDGKTDIQTIKIGTEMPMSSEKMKGIDDKFHAVKDFQGKNGTLVIFSACDCPFVVGNGSENAGWEGRYNEVYDHASKSGVGMVLINSNEAKRKGADSFEEIKKRAKDYNYKMNYLYDSQHKVADAYGAKFTPHVFLFDAEGKLVYTGAIDDNVRNPKKVKETYLIDALKELSEGKEITVKETRALGCSIKRV